jgi:hypothetical protein
MWAFADLALCQPEVATAIARLPEGRFRRVFNHDRVVVDWRW